MCFKTVWCILFYSYIVHVGIYLFSCIFSYWLQNLERENLGFLLKFCHHLIYFPYSIHLFFSVRFHCFSSVIVYKNLHIICVTSIFYNHLDVLLFRVMEVFFHKEILYLCSKLLIIEFYREVVLCTSLLSLVVLWSAVHPCKNAYVCSDYPKQKIS